MKLLDAEMVETVCSACPRETHPVPFYEFVLEAGLP
jgi:hypothetical protein